MQYSYKSQKCVLAKDLQTRLKAWLLGDATELEDPSVYCLKSLQDEDLFLTSKAKGGILIGMQLLYAILAQNVLTEPRRLCLSQQNSTDIVSS